VFELIQRGDRPTQAPVDARTLCHSLAIDAKTLQCRGWAVERLILGASQRDALYRSINSPLMRPRSLTVWPFDRSHSRAA